ncbi:helix-turn-helix domain-containing protein [Paenibacillaceae bacterium WGS1546]|uniref:helix-turn-helix domain-containing protein n=1 Tax=Cohnella sp. WGS1546 TaxID=3366810 RepID=UPI00372D79DB
MRALIVDDEKHVLEGLRTMIPWREIGITELDFADDGDTGWLRFARNRPDLVMTDMSMKRMHGTELIRKIRETDGEIPILVLSGYDDFAYTKTAIELNVTRYILKPSVPGEIEREIRDVLQELRRKQREKSIFADVRQQLERSVPILREQLLHQIVTAGIRQRELPADKLEFYRLSPAIFECGVVMSVKLYKSEREQFDVERQWQLYKFAVANIAEELLGRHDAGYVLRYADDRLPIVLIGGSPDGLVDRARRLAALIVDAVRSYLRVDLNVGIGQSCEDPARYAISLKESVEALELGELEGVNQINAYSDAEPDSPRRIRYPAEQIQRLSEALLAMERTAARSAWESIRRELLEESRTPIAYMHAVCTGMVSNLVLKLMEHDSRLIDPQRISELLPHIHQHRTLDGLVAWMSERIDEFYAAVEERNRDQRGPTYVEYVKKAVAERYNRKISFAELAGELNINRNYLSNLFKKEEGVSFVSYLGNYRIAKAKALLMKKRYTVYEIAEMVGYQDPAYFSRMFKNATGVSPIEYVLNQED